ncbi:type IV secretion system protein VirB5 [Bartonella vinsonii]|uniref:Type IV secretion system protein VirB5 n=2 Tax=Bartonella vinsonii subsp. berkhoffii TaxID=40933 RepID=N6VMZ9_BARVB|nr:type IV secretion system protein VirB5 [Bartonella vinsonii]AAF26364.1 17kDa antigen-like protein [Bartonella vinsonii subsp. berkhoffii]ENN94541.1 type IV secretion system protein VirB5 [Bartonella vinsonii subsp. berkhoffii str. Tweed]
MKKYSLVTLLSSFFISHAVANNSKDVDEYYKQALESTQKLNVVKSETAETIFDHATQTAKKIQEISEQLKQKQSQEKPDAEKLQTLQVELSVLQAKLQAEALKLQSLDMIQAKDSRTKEEIREEEIKKQHEKIVQKLKEKLEKSNVPSTLGKLND